MQLPPELTDGAPVDAAPAEPPPGRGRGVRLGELLEVIATVAITFAAVRAVYSVGAKAHYLPMHRSWARLHTVINPAIVVVSLCGGAGTLIEAARRRRPAIPGTGRWTHIIAGFYFCGGWLLRLPACLSDLLLWGRITTTLPWTWSCCESILFDADYHRCLAPALIGVVSARHLCRMPGDTRPDLREYLGRGLLLLIVIWWIIGPPLRHLWW